MKRNRFQQDILFEVLKYFHPNIKLTIEVNSEKFLNTKIILRNIGVVTTQEYIEKKIKKLHLGFL